MSRIAPNEIWALHPNTSFQPLGDGEGGVLLDTISGQLFTCNDTTAAFLSTVDGQRSFGAILQRLYGMFHGFESRPRARFRAPISCSRR